MALTWSVRNVKDYEKVTSHPDDPNKWHPVTEALVFLSMGCGFNEITEKNYKDVFKRINVYEKVHGAFLYGPDGPRLMTIDEVKAHIGLTTNASRFPATKFLKVLMRD